MKIIEMDMTLMTFADVHVIHLIVKWYHRHSIKPNNLFLKKKPMDIVAHCCIFSH